MTNEELVMKIKAGENELISELWLQIERYIKQQAYKFANGNSWADRCHTVGVTQDDLYCVGYFALEPAIQGYTADRGSFLTYFTYYLKSAFYKEIGVRKSGNKWYTRNDALDSAQSLDAPIGQNKDGDEMLLSDTAEDENAKQAFDDTEDALYNQRLREDLETAINSLRPRDANIIRGRYYNLLKPEELSIKYNLSTSNVKRIQREALQILKRHSALQNYRERFIGTTAFSSYSAWKASGMSQQERIIIKLDELERELGLK